MPKPLTRPEALRRILDGKRVPTPLFGLLLRDGLLRLSRQCPAVTSEGRALLRAGDEASA